MKSFLCELLFSSCLALTPEPAPLADLEYGTLLYAYYQDDYSGALVAALVAEKRGRRGEHPLRFELARGSFAFAEGMYGYAEDVFAAIDPDALTPIDRMRLSFHLAREHFRRGELDRVAAELDDISFGRTWRGRRRFHPEVEFMRAEIAVAEGDFDGARAALAKLDERDRLRAYGLFNLGVALRSAGDLAGAAQVLAELALTDAHDPETLDLVQRARLALALVRREQGAVGAATEMPRRRGFHLPFFGGGDESPDLTSAESVLAALPARGRYRDLALGTYGGLAMDQGNYELAARIYLTLEKADHWSASTAAARLAFPLSLEQMASTQLALAKYRGAERAYQARIASLSTLEDQLRDGEWVRGLMDAFAGPAGEDDAKAEPWRRAFGRRDWLEWLSRADVHGLLLDWRELRDAERWLATLPDELEVFAELAAEQRRRAAKARALLGDAGYVARYRVLGEELAAARSRLAAVEAAVPRPDDAWMLALADEAQAALITRLTAMRTLVGQAMQGTRRARFEARIDHLRGRVFWELVETRPNRLRALERKADAAAARLAALEERFMRVRRAESRFVASVERDFLAFRERAVTLRHRVAAARDARETRLAAHLARGLEREMRRLEHYLLATRVAIARATDKLALGAEG